MTEVTSRSDIPTPTPTMNPDTEAFWVAASEGKLLIKRCVACGEPHWYPRPVCPFCHSADTRWESASGLGAIYTFCISRRGRGEWKSAAPYVIAYVELDEGPRVMTNIVDCDPDSIEIGARVEVVFHRAGGDLAVPRFRPFSSHHNRSAG